MQCGGLVSGVVRLGVNCWQSIGLGLILTIHFELTSELFATTVDRFEFFLRLLSFIGLVLGSFKHDVLTAAHKDLVATEPLLHQPLHSLRCLLGGQIEADVVFLERRPLD